MAAHQGRSRNLPPSKGLRESGTGALRCKVLSFSLLTAGTAQTPLLLSSQLFFAYFLFTGTDGRNAADASPAKFSAFLCLLSFHRGRRQERRRRLPCKVLSFSLLTFFSPGPTAGTPQTPPLLSSQLFFAYFLFTGADGRNGANASPTKFSAFLCLLSFHWEPTAGTAQTPPLLSSQLFFAYFLFTGTDGRNGANASPTKFSAFLCLLSFHWEKKVRS